MMSYPLQNAEIASARITMVLLLENELPSLGTKQRCAMPVSLRRYWKVLAQ